MQKYIKISKEHLKIERDRQIYIGVFFKVNDVIIEKLFYGLCPTVCGRLHVHIVVGLTQRLSAELKRYNVRI